MTSHEASVMNDLPPTNETSCTGNYRSPFRPPLVVGPTVVYKYGTVVGAKTASILSPSSLQSKDGTKVVTIHCNQRAGRLGDRRTVLSKRLKKSIASRGVKSTAEKGGTYRYMHQKRAHS